MPTKAKMTAEQRAAARLAAHAKYNRSVKGAARYKRYEDKHPERAERWSPIMLAKGRRGTYT